MSLRPSPTSASDSTQTSRQNRLTSERVARQANASTARAVSGPSSSPGHQQQPGRPGPSQSEWLPDWFCPPTFEADNLIAQHLEVSPAPLPPVLVQVFPHDAGLLARGERVRRRARPRPEQDPDLVSTAAGVGARRESVTVARDPRRAVLGKDSTTPMCCTVGSRRRRRL